MTNKEQDRVIWRRDLLTLIGVTGSTVTRWMKAGKLPKPDIFFTRKRYGWRLSTLESAGVKLL